RTNWSPRSPALARSRARCPSIDPKKTGRLAAARHGWWWGGNQRQTLITQRLRAAANSCGTARNPAPTAGNRISSCLRRHQKGTPHRSPVRFPFRELNPRPWLLSGRPNVVLDHRLGLGAQEGIRLALVFRGRSSLPDGGDAPAAVTEGTLDEVQRIDAPVRDTAEPDDHLGIFRAHVLCVAPDLAQVGSKILGARMNDLVAVGVVDSV